jgi:type I restriction enzyme S subunit
VERHIGRSIGAKRKLIALLNEQKQIIIYRAMTCGFGPNIRYKSSGVRWLGDVPEHWQVKRIKYLLQAVDRRSVSGNETLLSMRMRHGLVPFFEHYDRPPQSATLVGFKIVRPRQIVINRMQAGNGLIFASTLNGIVSPDYSIFDVHPDASPEYLGCLFLSHHTRAKFRAESKGLGTGSSGFLRLYDDRLGCIHIAIPKRAEQEQILAILDVQLAGINKSVARVEREIDLIREYRARIITDVVTGQLDVREVSRTLPAEIDAPEPAVEAVTEDESEELLEAVAHHE